MTTTPTNPTNREKFIQTLTEEYVFLFANNAEYGHAARVTTPAALAMKMTNALQGGEGNKDGRGIKNTCKRLNIPYTYQGIQDYLGK
jgi:hypothetical protein